MPAKPYLVTWKIGEKEYSETRVTKLTAEKLKEHIQSLSSKDWPITGITVEDNKMYILQHTELDTLAHEGSAATSFIVGSKDKEKILQYIKKNYPKAKHEPAGNSYDEHWDISKEDEYTVESLHIVEVTLI